MHNFAFIFGLIQSWFHLCLLSKKRRGNWTSCTASCNKTFWDICPGLYLPQLNLTERKGVHEGLSDDIQAAVQIRRLLHVEHKLRVFHDVDPEAQGQTVTGRQLPGRKKTDILDFHIINIFLLTILNEGFSSCTKSYGWPSRTCWSSRCAAHLGQWSSCFQPERLGSRRSIWQHAGLCSLASPR